MDPKIWYGKGGGFFFNLKPRSRFYWMRKSAYCSMFSGLCSAHWSFGYLLVFLKQHAWLGCRCAWRGSTSPVGTNCANWWVWKRIVISMQLRDHGVAPIGYGLHESHDVTAGKHCITSLRSHCGMVSTPELMLIAHLLPVGMPLWNPWSLSESFGLRRPTIWPTLMRWEGLVHKCGQNICLVLIAKEGGYGHDPSSVALYAGVVAIYAQGASFIEKPASVWNMASTLHYRSMR